MKKNGFTLIELLIVVSIFGILAVVIIPNVRAWQKENRDKDIVAAQGQSIDRILTGTVVTVDRVGNYSTLHFSDGTECLVTNESLDRFGHLLNQVWEYQLHRTASINIFYELVGVR